MIVGYARTSTSEQRAGLDAQIRDLKAAGCEKIFSEQISSAVAQRPRLAECLHFLRETDTLMVTRPDRLARSTHELLRISEELAQTGVGLVIQSMGLDTRNGSNPTAKLMLSVLAAIAQFERDLMLERQHEGIARARAEGKYKGRPQSLDRAAVQRMRADGIGPAAIAAKLGIARDAPAGCTRHQRQRRTAPKPKHDDPCLLPLCVKVRPTCPAFFAAGDETRRPLGTAIATVVRPGLTWKSSSQVFMV